MSAKRPVDPAEQGTSRKTQDGLLQINGVIELIQDSSIDYSGILLNL